MSVLRAAAGGNSASCLPHERDALLAFKQILQASSTRGVRCSNQTGRVHELRLGSTALVGQISPSVLALQHLEHLDQHLSLNNMNLTTVMDWPRVMFEHDPFSEGP